MKVSTRTKIIETEIYIAKDGKVFEDKDECILYEKRLDGLIKDCPDCGGTGKIQEEYEYDNYHTGAPEKTTIHTTCPKCNGKGYLEKKLKEVWE